ncbi:MAG: response regulator [Pseudobutyrivibrio sp.]|nr:response regulator [Pseudobutyrivibrio sp.]
MYLKDKLIEDDLPVYIIGYPEDISIVEQTVPSTIILERFIRPINLAEAIDQFDISMRENVTEGKKKILVVDDSGPMLRKVKTWFEAKYRVFVANSGTAAIKALTTNKPDLILLDYEMPVVDGKQVLEMIRSEEEFAEIPVIFLTGKSDRATVESVLKLKPEGYLLKTMPPMEIEKAVDDFFLKRRAIK